MGGQAAASILAHAREDHLPGVTDARLEAMAGVPGDFNAAPGDQGDARSEATKLRARRDAAFAAVLRLRHDAQFAADLRWPWHGGGENAAVCREFLLPAGRPFTA